MSIQPDLVQAVAAFVPSYVVRDMVAGHPPQPGSVSLSEGAVIFADVAGFTRMAERLARLMRGGSQDAEGRGAEELTRLINQIFSAMMAPIREQGGVITRFSGDALTAYFERPAQLAPADVVHATLACAHAMHHVLAPFGEVHVESEVFSVSVKIGLAYGAAVFLVVGDEERTMESVLVGRVVAEAAAAQAHARRGEVVLGPSAWSTQIGESGNRGIGESGNRGIRESENRQITDTAAPQDYRVMPPPQGDAVRLSPVSDPLEGLDATGQEHVLQALAPYLPRPIYDRLLLAQGDLPGDYRRVTNLFVFFDGLDVARYPRSPETLHAEAADIAAKMQAYYGWAYDVVDRYEGRLIHVLADDKGTGLHILFGAPEKHADDPTRGLLCALALQNDPAQPSFVTRQRIGVSSGIIFAATVGSAWRREYTVFGDQINLSARLTGACPAGQVLVDAYTRDRTVRQFEFEALPPLELKGKSQPVTCHQLLSERPVETGLVARSTTDGR